jgi:uncharacterized iron-regulated membrane protein
MSALPSTQEKRRWRPFARVWHRWFGILGGLWLLLLAVTGSAITFYDEIDSWLNPDLRTIPSGMSVRAPVDLAVTQARAALPGLAVNNILLPTHPRATIWMLGRAPIGEGRPRPVEVFTDPRDGRVLGWRESGALSLDRRHAMNILYGLHIDLLAGPWMTWFFGLVSLAWLIDHAIALWLAVPKLARWRAAFAVAGKPGSLRRLFDWHRAPAMWWWPVTFVLALTGVTLAWPEDSRHAVALVSPVTGRLHESWPDRDAPAAPISIEAAIAAVTQDRSQLHSVRIIPDHAAYAVRTFDRRDPDDQGRLWTYVAMTDGRILARRHDNGSSGGDLFFAWQYPLHSGKAFGAIGRWIVFLGGLVTAALVVTGWMLWLRRRSRRR